MPQTQQKKTKSYSLEPTHIATIIQVAKDNGNCSESAALRHIVDEFVRLRALEAMQGSRRVPVSTESQPAG